jgi:hypothetical protein
MNLKNLNQANHHCHNTPRPIQDLKLPTLKNFTMTNILLLVAASMTQVWNHQMEARNHIARQLRATPVLALAVVRSPLPPTPLAIAAVKTRSLEAVQSQDQVRVRVVKVQAQQNHHILSSVPIIFRSIN